MKREEFHTCPLDFGNQQLTLIHDRALYWESHQTLFVADIHLGKAAHFRKHGIALPTQITTHDLERINRLIRVFGPRHVVIVGDLVHAQFNREVALWKDLTAGFPSTDFTLVKGNHDRYTESHRDQLGILKVVDELYLENLGFVHQGSSAAPFTISGHLHPGVRIKTKTNKNLRLPCFIVTDNLLILPAFSKFTGLDTGFRPVNARYYACHEDGIFRV